MKILLLGGSGFVGRAIVRAAQSLEDDTLRVRVLLRDQNALPEHALLEKQVGELSQLPAELEPDEPYVLVHFAVKQIDHDRTGFSAINVDANRRLEHQLSDRLQGVIYGSSMSVYGSQAQEGISEHTLPAPATALARSRHQAESLWLEAAERRKISGYVLRPRFVLGHGDRFVMPGLASAYARGLLPGSGQQRFSIIDVDDYARIVLQLAERCLSGVHPGGVRRPLNVAYEQPVSMDEIVDALRVARPRERRIHRVPATPGWLRALRLFGGRRGEALTTRLELLGLSHWAQVDALRAEVGSSIIERDPRICLQAAVAGLGD